MQYSEWYCEAPPDAPTMTPEEWAAYQAELQPADDDDYDDEPYFERLLD